AMLTPAPSSITGNRSPAPRRRTQRPATRYTKEPRCDGDAVSYWLMKSEPDTYSIDDLERDRMEPWEGIRNFQARNMIREDMQPGDKAFFYHSSCEVPAIVGIMKI